MACDCLDTREVYKIPLVRVNLNSKQVNGLVTIGIYDGIPVGYDCLLHNDLVLQSDSNKEVTVVTRSRSKQECNSMSHPNLFNSVTNPGRHLQIQSNAVRSHWIASDFTAADEPGNGRSQPGNLSSLPGRHHRFLVGSIRTPTETESYIWTFEEHLT